MVPSYDAGISNSNKDMGGKILERSGLSGRGMKTSQPGPPLSEDRPIGVGGY